MNYRTKAYGEEGNVKYVTKEKFDSYIESIKKRYYKILQVCRFLVDRINELAKKKSNAGVKFL